MIRGGGRSNRPTRGRFGRRENRDARNTTCRQHDRQHRKTQCAPGETVCGAAPQSNAGLRKPQRFRFGTNLLRGGKTFFMELSSFKRVVRGETGFGKKQPQLERIALPLPRPQQGIIHFSRAEIIASLLQEAKSFRAARGIRLRKTGSGANGGRAQSDASLRQWPLAQLVELFVSGGTTCCVNAAGPGPPNTRTPFYPAVAVKAITAWKRRNRKILRPVCRLRPFRRLVAASALRPFLHLGLSNDGCPPLPSFCILPFSPFLSLPRSLFWPFFLRQIGMASAATFDYHRAASRNPVITR